MGFCWRSNLSYHDIRSFYVRSENAMDSRAGGELVLFLLNMSSSLARTEEEDISKAWPGIDKINLCQSKERFPVDS